MPELEDSTDVCGDERILDEMHFSWAVARSTKLKSWLLTDRDGRSWVPPELEPWGQFDWHQRIGDAWPILHRADGQTAVLDGRGWLSRRDFTYLLDR